MFQLLALGLKQSPAWLVFDNHSLSTVTYYSTSLWTCILVFKTFLFCAILILLIIPLLSAFLADKKLKLIAFIIYFTSLWKRTHTIMIFRNRFLYVNKACKHVISAFLNYFHKYHRCRVFWKRVLHFNLFSQLVYQFKKWSESVTHLPWLH